MRWISDQNENRNKLAYLIQLSYFYSINIAKLYLISQLIWDSFSIGNPPIIFILLGEYPIDIDFGQRSHQFATPHVGRLQIQVDKTVPVLSKSWFVSPENTHLSKLYGRYHNLWKMPKTEKTIKKLLGEFPDVCFSYRLSLYKNAI